MAVWRFLVLACVLFTPGFIRASAQEPGATAAATATPSPVPIRAYNEKGQLTGSGWALPLDGAYITVRSLLANAARAELVFSEEMPAPVAEVGGEDIEGNLVRIALNRPADPTGWPISERRRPNLRLPGRFPMVGGIEFRLD